MGHESNNAPSTVDNFTTETNHGNRGAGRRTACILCRDRKVRCDGARPTCDRCLAANETCVYANPARRSKADMLETINDLRDQLEQSQAQLAARMAPMPPMSAADTSILPKSSLGSSSPQTPFISSPQSFDPMDGTSSLYPGGMSGLQIDEFWDWYGNTSSQLVDVTVDATIALPTTFDPPDRASFSQACFAPTAPMRGTDPITTLTDANDTYMCATLSSTEPNHNSPADSMTPRRSSGSSKVPSLRDVLDSTRDSLTPETIDKFVKDISRALAAQHGVIGIADTVAKYMSFLSKQGMMDPSGHSPHNTAYFIQVIEQRVRELGNIASHEVMDQIFPCLNALAAYGCSSNRAADLQDTHFRHAQRVSKFFDSAYDIERPLTAQMMTSSADDLQQTIASNP